jgi:hypothetical protein
MIGLPVLAMSVMFSQIQSGKGFIIRTNGDVVPFNPTVEHEDYKVYEMKSVREACNFDYFEIARLNDDMILICDEEALCKNSPVINTIATKLYQNAYNNDSIGIFGDCVICHTRAVN